MTSRSRLGIRLATLAAWVVFAPWATARTIVLTDRDCEKMAFIQAVTPNWSWAGYDIGNGIYSTGQFYLYQDRAFLIRFPIERIPKGQRIVKAELSFKTTLQPAGELRLALRRILGDWGPGVSWLHRRARPKKETWSQPGGRGAGTDRMARVSAVIRTSDAGEKTVNVTEDVEAWYTSAAVNHGWMLTLEDADAYVLMPSPLWGNRGVWQLRITYEPE